jgi:acetyl-CoA carboxylase carboxyl transferase subunit beta
MPLFSKKNYSTVKVRKRDIPDGLWLKCPGCQEIIFKQELDRTSGVCPKCGYHFQINRKDRINMLMEEGTFEEWDADLYSVDTLSFTGTASYASKLEENVRKTGFHDAISIGRGMMAHHAIGLGVMDFSFLGASMGSVVGEKVTRLIEKCTEAEIAGHPVLRLRRRPHVRGHVQPDADGQDQRRAGPACRGRLPYIPVLTHPTTAGVMASFATLGDVIVAEPNALIGFAGPRVIKETTQQDLPEGFQRSEFLLKHGLLDVVVSAQGIEGDPRASARLPDGQDGRRRQLDSVIGPTA